VAKDDKSDGDDNLNMFSGVLGLASGSKTEGKEGGGGRSEVENLQTLLESLFQKLSGGGDSDKPHKAHNAGDGQLSAGPGLADMPSLLPSGSKSVDNPEQAADMPSKAEGDQKFEDKLRSIVLPGHGIELHGL
jgi:hypothetical protein